MKFLIIPCGHPVRVKIFTQKKLLKAVDIISATTIQLYNKSIDFDRFLLKFVPLNVDDASQRSELILFFHFTKVNIFIRNFSAVYFKLAATKKSSFINYPTLPMDTRVEEITSLSSCRNSTITWHSSPDHRPIT